MEVIYKVSDIRSLISESSNEFKAVLGSSVESENKKNNGKAYSDAKKRAKDYDGGLTKEVGEEKSDYVKSDENKTTLDYVMDNVPEDYKKRVKAQVKGYTSELEMNNGIDKNGDFTTNDDIYQSIKKSGEELHKNQQNFKETGLQASKMPKDTFKKDEIYESKDGFEMRKLINTLKESSKIEKQIFTEQKNIKTIYFKKSTFLTEGHMKTRIPDDFKVEGCQFKMKDKNGTIYLLEWANGDANVISCNNKVKIDETMDKFHNISNFTNDRYETSNYKNRLNENETEISRMLNIIRNIKKD